MSALAQRTYQAYFDKREWSDGSIHSECTDENGEFNLQQFTYDECNDGEIGYNVESCSAASSLALTDLALGLNYFISSPTLHSHYRSASATPWVAIKKTFQRLIVVPITRTEDLAVKFSVLTELWRKDTEFSSSPVSIVEHAAYREIVSWGMRALPLILRDLELNGGYWFQALQELTNINPVHPSDAGRIKKMKEAWLNWGRENKLI